MIFLMDHGVAGKKTLYESGGGREHESHTTNPAQKQTRLPTSNNIMYAHTHTHTYIHTHTHTNIHTYTNIHKYNYMCAYVCTYACLLPERIV